MSDLELLLRQIADPSELPWNEETYDLALARGVTGVDRAKLVDTLVAQGKRGDTRAILTLGHLQAAEALPWLGVAARSDEPWAATARRAMALAGRGVDVVDLLAADAVQGPTKMGRVAAVLALGTIEAPAALDAIEQALADPEYEVRMLAWDALIAAHGLEPRLRGPDGKRTKTTLLELDKDLLACELPSLVALGVDELRALSKALRAGASPDALGLVWTADPAPELRRRITQVAFDADASYPVDEIARLSGVARRWVEAALVMRLDQDTPDGRVPDALARLGAQWTRPVLDEVARTRAVSPALASTLARAVATLASP